MAEEKLSKAQKLYRKYLAKMQGLLESMDANEVYKELANGKNSYMKLSRLQTSAFDSTWIDQVEDVIFDLGDIINNPRMNTKSVSDIVPVELSRKVNAESVRHLASHTQFIKDIDEHGNVIPNKVLNISYEDDLHTYENRFIATFVRKLVLFVEKRYEFIESIAPMYNENILYFKNESQVGGNDVYVETKIKVLTETEDNSRERLRGYLDRILQIREYILYFYNSPFMKKLKTEKNVRNPILQTNIIRKNLKYHHCFEVYKFIESYESLGMTNKVNESYAKLSPEEIGEINNVIMVNYLLSQVAKEAPNAKVSSKVYKPKILTSMDDESFVYGPLYEGPISFVRTDEGFREWFTNKISKELPDHPKKHEKEFYREEFSVKKEIKEDITETESLLKRKKRETERFNKIVEKVIAEREEEARKAEEARLAAIKAQEEEELNKVREAVKERARKDFPTKPTDEVDKIVDEILNEGYNPDDVEFQETLASTVNTEVKDINEPEPVEEETTITEEYVAPKEELTPEEEAAIPGPAEITDNKEEFVEYPNPEFKEDEEMESTPVEELPNKPINLVKEEEALMEGKKEEEKPAEEVPEEEKVVDNYDEDDGTGVWYIVRQFQGFYVSDTETTRQKDKAKIFKSEAAIRRFKMTHYGRVKRYVPTNESK